MSDAATLAILIAGAVLSILAIVVLLPPIYALGAYLVSTGNPLVRLLDRWVEYWVNKGLEWERRR